MSRNTPSRVQHRLPLYRRAWFLVLATVIIIATIVSFIILVTKPSAERAAGNAPDSRPSTTAVQSSPINSDEDGPVANPDQVVVQYEGENPNNASELSGSVTYTDYSDGTLAVGTMIDQFLPDGTCELRATDNSGRVYTATSGIIPAASTSACRELSVAVPSGNYTLEIILNSNGKQGTISKEVAL